MDFPNAKLPALKPLANSAGQSNFDIENELRNLFIKLFTDSMAETVFDANVLGMAHIGSLNLVRKAVNYDGLVLLAGDREETATRYLYRAWKSRNNQGRGLHFLRTYLQLLFPNAWVLNQLAQHKSYPYPTKLIPSASADANYFLTSRIRISLDYHQVTPESVIAMNPVLRSVIPARMLLNLALLAEIPCKYYVACGIKIRQKIVIRETDPIQSVEAVGLHIASSIKVISTIKLSTSV